MIDQLQRITAAAATKVINNSHQQQTTQQKMLRTKVAKAVVALSSAEWPEKT